MAANSRGARWFASTVAGHAEVRGGDRHCCRSEKTSAVMVDSLRHVISPLGVFGENEVACLHDRMAGVTLGHERRTVAERLPVT